MAVAADDEDLVKLTNDSLIENNYGEDEEGEDNHSSNANNHRHETPFEESKLNTHSSVANDYLET